MGVSYVTELKNLLVRRPSNFPQYVVGESYQEIWSFTNKLSKVTATIFFGSVILITYMNIVEAQIKARSHVGIKHEDKAYITQAFYASGPDELGASQRAEGKETISALALNSN